MKKSIYIFKTERCICCGREIPEGRQVCPVCEAQLYESPTGEKMLTKAAHKAAHEEKKNPQLLSTRPRVFKHKKK